MTKEKPTGQGGLISTLNVAKSIKSPSLRKAINDCCNSCVVDPANAGNWRQQVTMCSCHDCSLYPVRPVSSSDIPESVLIEYGVPEWEKSRFRGPRRAFFETNPAPNTFVDPEESAFSQNAEKAHSEGNVL
jgi:hypothetical protein